MFDTAKVRTMEYGKWILLAVIVVVLGTVISLTAIGYGSDAKASAGSTSSVPVIVTHAG
jgi:hypothetical protein